MRGTNFCTDALLGAIYAELGLMVVTADMEHLRNRALRDTPFTVTPRYGLRGANGDPAPSGWHCQLEPT